MTVNQTQLAELLKVSDVTLWEWQKLELPLPMLKHGARGEPNQYDLAAVLEWYIAREVVKRAPKSAREERDAIDLELRQLDLAERKRTMVPAAEVKPLWDSYVLTAAAFMAGRHSRLAAILEAAPGIEAKRALLKESDATFLTKLGGDGERMQNEVEALLATLPAAQASAFLRRVAGADDKPLELAAGIQDQANGAAVAGARGGDCGGSPAMTTAANK